MTEMERFAKIVELGQKDQLPTSLKRLLADGVTVDAIINDGIMPGLKEVGRKFSVQEYFLPEMLLATRTAKYAGQLLTDVCGAIQPQFAEKVVLGTVKNDLHDIGKNMVRMAMENLGLSVIDLGVDVSKEQFVQVAEQDDQVAFVGISALLTTTLPVMRETVEALKASKAAGRIQIMVGGAPVTADFAAKIGADIYTAEAFEAAQTVRNILEKRYSR